MTIPRRRRKRPDWSCLFAAAARHPNGHDAHHSRRRARTHAPFAGRASRKTYLALRSLVRESGRRRRRGRCCYGASAGAFARGRGMPLDMTPRRVPVTLLWSIPSRRFWLLSTSMAPVEFESGPFWDFTSAMVRILPANGGHLSLIGCLLPLPLV